MAYYYAAKCSCGSVKLDIQLSDELKYYQIRMCDCDFCSARHIGYLSDPAGKSQIASNTALQKERQGSNQADFVSCASCKSVIAVVWQVDPSQAETGHYIGAINAKALFRDEQLGQTVTVSPKQLTAKEKTTRWQALWMPITIQAT